MKIHARFREYEKGGTKGFVDFTVNGSVCINDAVLMEGQHGHFVKLPQEKVEDEYRDFITGVSNEFRNLLLEAALAAKEANDLTASVGEASRLFFHVRATALDKEGSKCKALASLTVKDGEDAEKSSFTISGIRVMEGEHGHFISVPQIKTDNPEYPYNDLCGFTKDTRVFVHNLIWNKAKIALGIEKPNLDQAIKEAGCEVAKSPKEPVTEKEAVR